METKQIDTTSIEKFIVDKQKEILAFALNNTDEVVKTELELMDFELLLAINTKEGESEENAEISRELRNSSWNELNQIFNGDNNKISQFISEF